MRWIWRESCAHSRSTTMRRVYIAGSMALRQPSRQVLLLGLPPDWLTLHGSRIAKGCFTRQWPRDLGIRLPHGEDCVAERRERDESEQPLGCSDPAGFAVLRLVSNRFRDLSNRRVRPHLSLRQIRKRPRWGLFVSGGERGIRTLDRGLAYTPLAGARLQPLGHLSRTRFSFG